MSDINKNVRRISYVRNNNYIRAFCKLKDGIDTLKLKEFFNRLYSLKLDIYCFLNGYSSDDLIKFFSEILDGEGVISLKNLCLLIGNSGDIKKNIYPILVVIGDFFDMFDIIEEEVVSLNSYDDIRLYVEAGVSEDFSFEVESIFYNTVIFDYISSKKVRDLRKQSCFC